MSRPHIPTLVVEWSPTETIAYSSGTKILRRASTMSEATHGLDGSVTVLGIARSACFVRAAQIPHASRADRELIVQNMLGTLFPLPASELAFDFSSDETPGMSSTTVLVAAMKSDWLKQATMEASHAGLKVSKVVPAAISAPTVVATSGLSSAALVQPHEGGLQIDVVQNNLLRYSRTVTSTVEAQSEIDRTFAAAGVDSFPVVSLDGIYPDPDYTVRESTLEALSGIDIGTLGINLELTERKIARREAIRKVALRNAGAALVASLILAGVVVSNWITQKNQGAEALVVANASLKSLQDHKLSLDKDLDGIAPQKTLIDRAFKPAQYLSDVLTIVSADSPKNIWLKGFTVERGKSFTLEGTSLTSIAVSDFVQKLSSESRFRNVQLLFAHDALSNKIPIVEFSLSGFPIGNLPLVDNKQSGVTQ